MSTPAPAASVRVRVTCKRPNGMFRAGRHWPQGNTEAEVDRAAAKALAAEPLLVVSVHDGKGWRVVSKAAPEEAPTPAKGEPPLPSEVAGLLKTIEQLREQLRQERDLHHEQLAEVVAKHNAEVAELQAQVEALTAPPPADAPKA